MRSRSIDKVIRACASCLVHIVCMSFLGLAMVGVASYWKPFAAGFAANEIAYERFTGSRYFIWCTHGEIELVSQRLAYDSYLLQSTKDAGRSGPFWIDYDNNHSRSYIELQGHHGRGILSGAGLYVVKLPEAVFGKSAGSTTVIGFPWWSGLLVFGALVYIAVSKMRVRWQARRRNREGRCLHCGYPMRPTPSVVCCPECGNEVRDRVLDEVIVGRTEQVDIHDPHARSR